MLTRCAVSLRALLSAGERCSGGRTVFALQAIYRFKSAASQTNRGVDQPWFLHTDADTWRYPCMDLSVVGLFYDYVTATLRLFFPPIRSCDRWRLFRWQNHQAAQGRKKKFFIFMCMFTQWHPPFALSPVFSCPVLASLSMLPLEVRFFSFHDANPPSINSGFNSRLPRRQRRPVDDQVLH